MLGYDVLLICTIVSILYIWFKTDAFIEWVELLTCKKIQFKEYIDCKKSSVPSIRNMSYPEYLMYSHSESFFAKLVSCPICSSVWLNIASLSVFSTEVGGFKMLGLNILAVWILYRLVEKLLNE